LNIGCLVGRAARGPLASAWPVAEATYPNAADRILGSKQNLGGNIFLHGNGRDHRLYSGQR